MATDDPLDLSDLSVFAPKPFQPPMQPPQAPFTSKQPSEAQQIFGGQMVPGQVTQAPQTPQQQAAAMPKPPTIPGVTQPGAAATPAAARVSKPAGDPTAGLQPGTPEFDRANKAAWAQEQARQGGGADGFAGELAPGVPPGGIGLDTSPKQVPEMVAFGTGAKGNSGIVGQNESSDNPAALNPEYDPDGSKHGDGIPRSASGLYGITDQNWRTYGPQAGINVQQFPSAISTMKAGEELARNMQRRVAGRMYQKLGWEPWVHTNPKIAQAVGYTGQTAPTGGMGMGGGGRAAELEGQTAEMAAGIPGDIRRYEQTAQDVYAEQERIANEADQELQLQKQQFQYYKRVQAETAAREAAALKSDDEKMQEWARNTPTRQAVYAATMHTMPLVSLLLAIGGAATGLHGMAMLGALRGLVDGVNEGNEDNFKTAMDRWKETYLAYKDHFNNTMQVYDKLVDSYKDRADGEMKAADLTLKIMNDQMNAQQLRITSAKGGLDARVKTVEALAKAAKAFSDIELNYGLSQWSPKELDYLAVQSMLDRNWQSNMGRGPQGRALVMEIAKRRTDMAIKWGISPGQLVSMQGFQKAYTAALQRHTFALAQLHQYMSTFKAQRDIVKQYLSSAVAGTGGEKINAFWQYVRKGIVGNPQVVAFYNAVTGLSREHGKIITGAAGSTAELSVAAQHTASTLINENMNAVSILTAMDEMTKEVDEAENAADDTQNQMAYALQNILPTGMPFSNMVPNNVNPFQQGIATEPGQIEDGNVWTGPSLTGMTASQKAKLKADPKNWAPYTTEKQWHETPVQSQ